MVRVRFDFSAVEAEKPLYVIQWEVGGGGGGSGTMELLLWVLYRFN